MTLTGEVYTTDESAGPGTPPGPTVVQPSPAPALSPGATPSPGATETAPAEPAPSSSVQAG